MLILTQRREDAKLMGKCWLGIIERSNLSRLENLKLTGEEC
jgi:hypothetical protein